MSSPPPTTPEPAAAEPPLDRKQLLKLAVELGPIVVFFLANSQAGIFWGTGCFMIATVLSLAASRLLLGRVPIMPFISAVFILFFGSLTLLLQDELFIKMKPTFINLFFSATLFIGLYYGRPLIKYLLADAFRLTEEGWTSLTMRWAFFFLLLAGLNEVVWRYFSTDFWLLFKIWGIMPLTLVFAMLQLGLIKQHSLPEHPPSGP